MKIYLLTKNSGKLKAAKSTFDKYNIELLPVEKDYPEIQADSSLEIAKFSAIQAAKDLDSIVIREDHSLFINALKFPGPYTNYFEKKISSDELLEIIKLARNNQGEFEVATVCAKPNGETFEYVFRVPMYFGDKVKVSGRGWNGLIHLNNEQRAITEYPEEERLPIWNQGYEAMVKKLMGLK
jgi:non-canonical purine NTP pyrophosphatase (RdgB/HAM1 family)